MKTKGFLSLFVIMILVLALSGCTPSQPSGSQTPTDTAGDGFPDSNIRLVLPNAPGGAVEMICRQFQPYLEAELGQPLMIDNVEGGGGIIGTMVLKNAEADGYTIQAKSMGSLINSWLLQDAEFGIDDFDYLGRFTNDPGVILVHKDAPYNNMTEFIEWAKTQPEGSVTMSLANITDINFIGLKQIEEATGLKFNIIGYNSGGSARLAVVSGEVVGTHCNYFGAASVWEDTKVLAVHLDENTIPNLAGVQTVNEAVGKDTVAISTNFELLAPKGFMEKYPERAEKLLAAFNAAWNNPEFLASLKEQGMEGYVEVLSPEETEREVREMNDYLNENKSLFDGVS